MSGVPDRTHRGRPPWAGSQGGSEVPGRKVPRFLLGCVCGYWLASEGLGGGDPVATTGL